MGVNHAEQSTQNVQVLRQMIIFKIWLTAIVVAFAGFMLAAATDQRDRIVSFLGALVIIMVFIGVLLLIWAT